MRKSLAESKGKSKVKNAVNKVKYLNHGKEGLLGNDLQKKKSYRHIEQTGKNAKRKNSYRKISRKSSRVISRKSSRSNNKLGPSLNSLSKMSSSAEELSILSRKLSIEGQGFKASNWEINIQQHLVR